MVVMREQLLVEPDSRGRVSLGALLAPGRYLASVDGEGRVVLEPAVVLTATEERLLSDPDFRARMTSAASEPVDPLDLEAL